MREEVYKDKVNELRLIRIKERMRFRDTTEKMMGLINSFKNKDDDGIPAIKDLPTISFHDMKNLEKDIWYNVDEDVSFRLAESFEDKLKFSVIMKAGAKLALKKHDSLQCIVINEGKLLDLTTNTSYLKGDEVIYLAYEPHEHASEIYTEYVIFFHQPESK